jgi:hypothetical protein
LSNTGRIRDGYYIGAGTEWEKTSCLTRFTDNNQES